MAPRIRKTLLVVHIVVSVALAGEVWGLVVLNTVATLTEDLALAQTAYRLMPFMIFAGGVPLSMTAFITGVALGLGSHWGLLRYYWVAIKLVLLLAVIGVGIFVFDPEGMAAATEGARQVAASRQWGQVAALSTQIVMLLAATTLSVFKPRWRLR